MKKIKEKKPTYLHSYQSYIANIKDTLVYISIFYLFIMFSPKYHTLLFCIVFKLEITETYFLIILI